MTKLLSIPFVLTLALGACTQEVSVSISCVTTGAPAVECTVTQTKGTVEVEACWDFQQSALLRSGSYCCLSFSGDGNST